MKKSSKENMREIRELFSKISIKKGFISTLFLVVITVIVLFIPLNELNLNSTWQELIIDYAIFLIPFFLFLWVFRRVNYPIISIVKGNSYNASQVLLVIPLIIISISLAWIIILGLNLISEGIAENYLNWLNSVQMLTLGPETTLLQYVLFFGLVSILAPVIEEIIFRGIIIERLGAKYNYRWAVIISSTIFAFLHVSQVLDAFIFGVVLSLVYLKTESLMIPILIHVVNNITAFFFMIAYDKFSFNYGSWDTVGPYISNALVGIFLFTFGITWLGWFLRHNWQIVNDKQSFKIEPEKA